jgi:hypothetical protein
MDSNLDFFNWLTLIAFIFGSISVTNAFFSFNTFAKMLVENLFFDIVFIGFLNITKDSRDN